jgi:hypothetical protein
MSTISKLDRIMIEAANFAAAYGRLDAEMLLLEAPTVKFSIEMPKPPKPFKSQLFPRRKINARYLVAAGGLTTDWRGVK